MLLTHHETGRGHRSGSGRPGRPVRGSARRVRPEVSRRHSLGYRNLLEGWNPHALPVRKPAAGALMLPAWGSATPTVVRRADEAITRHHTAVLARGLLAAGVLRPDDWSGDLRNTIRQGWKRWMYETRATELGMLDLSFSYTDRPSGIHDPDTALVTEGWENCGFLALFAQSYPLVFVGETVKLLNAARRGLGYRALRAAEAGLANTVGACTPAWAREWIEWRWDYADYTDEEIDECGFVTLKRFNRAVPPAASSTGPVSVAALARDASARLAPPLQRVAELAHATLQATEALGSIQDDTLTAWRDSEPVKAGGLYWADVPSDPIRILADEMHDTIANSGYETTCVWSTGFDADDPEEVAAAAARLRAVLAVLVPLDQLLECISELGKERVRVHVG